MTVPYVLVVIKPLSVGRGDAPAILEDILFRCPVSLRMFRQFVICESTLVALTQSVGPQPSSLDYEQEKVHPHRYVSSWICVFTHLDRQTDPLPILHDYCGPLSRTEWLPHHLRYTYGANLHPSDTVVHIPVQERTSYEANLLFLQFNENTI